jgi:hypothetical protein
MGTAYDTESQSSPVYIRNFALARCIADVWDTNQRLANQFDPYRMTELLPRWEKFLKVYPLPTDTMSARREPVRAKFARFGKASTYQRVVDIATAYLGSITFTVTGGDSTTANINWPEDWIDWYSPTIAGVIAMSGIATESYDIVIHILTTGGVGASTFQWSSDGGVTWTGPATTAASYTLGTTGLTAEFIAGTHTAGDYHQWYVGPKRWASSVAHILILCTVPTGMTEAEYYRRTGNLSKELDDVLPAWMTFDVGRNGTSPGEFILDDEHNLDNEVLSLS